VSFRDIEDLRAERGIAGTNPDLDISPGNGNLAV
jgi:hypothetical protein